MNKREIPIISLVLSILCILSIIHLLVDAVQSYIELSSRNASGHEWLGFGIYPVFCGISSIIGAVSSCFCGVKAKVTWVKIVAFVFAHIFGMILIFCFLGLGSANGVISAFGWFANLFI